MIIFRCLFAFCAAAVGSFFFWELFKTINAAVIGGLAGIMLAVLIILLEQKVKKIPLRVVIGGVAGFTIGLILANLSSFALLFYYPGNSIVSYSVYLMMNCLFGFLGLSIGIGKRAEPKIVTR